MVTGRPVAAITGASAGIGAQYARQLAARGYDLILAARRTDRLEALGHELQAAHGINTRAVTVDLAVPDAVDRFGAQLAAEPLLGLLVNNAGFGTKGRFFETDPAGQADMHMVHVVATMKLTRAVLPGLMERRSGGIINVASMSGFFMMPGNVSYCSTKSWMIAFSEGVDLELRCAGSPVRIQALCPGYTYSEFHDVMGVSRKSIPRWMWRSSEDVVAQSLHGFDRAELIVIPGWPYRLAVRLLGILPKPLHRAIGRSYGERHRKAHRAMASASRPKQPD
jgi:short-subunit dehydrogenase